MEGVKKRAIIIWDVDINGDTSEVYELHQLVNEYANEFKQFLRSKNAKLANLVTIEGDPKAGVPQAERRGPTGELKDIVFRGTRGTNHKVKIPMRTSKTEQMISAGVKKRLQEFRNRIGARNLFSDDQLTMMLETECDHMMELYNAGEPLQYSDSGSKAVLCNPEQMKTMKFDTQPKKLTTK